MTNRQLHRYNLSFYPIPGGGGSGGHRGRTGREIMSWEEADTRDNPHPSLAPLWVDYLANRLEGAVQGTNVQVTNLMDGEEIAAKVTTKGLKRLTRFK